MSDELWSTISALMGAIVGGGISFLLSLLNARSKGAYYNDHIRDRYPCH